MASLRDIAKEAGVSVATVSRALNDDSSTSATTRELILDVANRLGYISSPGRKSSSYVGFAHVGHSHIYNSAFLDGVYDSALLAGAVRGLDAAHLSVAILSPHRDRRPSETWGQYFRRMDLRAAILRTTSQSRQICEAIAEEGFPAIVVSERFDNPKVNYVDCDSRTDSVRALEYLIALGHRRIAFAMNVVPDCDHLDRFEGYKKALEEHGIDFDEKLVFRQQASLQGGATVMERIVCMPDPPTAVYFADQVLVLGAINKSQQLGVRIPESLSIVGFDDAETRYSVHPKLTAVCQDASRLGFEAATQLGRLLSGKVDQVQMTIQSFFEVNESTGAPRPQGMPIRCENRVSAIGNEYSQKAG